ncbi:ABC transporter ATP-binding protein [Dongia soli]|uniref:Oligopeptide/dipeptide ABC transporter ATP-binding protein n=1 Tax=Dongia soli TaxID=600628 RepID=A0ABU5EBC2_9PROT|nr:oligopeptide/dipeptide ABC transporter ATP-binding protein [Dongia soli]MDY0883651.1 oligopeptide/dipeptide ABC transporter ATP-binding protein [Dongia soli]
MADVLVSLRYLSRDFHSRAGLFGERRVLRAVNDVSLDIATGQVTGVVGESGCGKSTLARLVLRLLDASGGKVMFDGIDLGSLPARRLRKLRQRMQMVFQDPYSAIDPRYSIREALLEPLQVQGIRLARGEAAAKVDRLMDVVGLSRKMAEAYPHQLSGGQKQRIGIARALILQPSFLVLDEPTASLDVSIQAQVINLLEGLKTEYGLTYLFISHDLGLVRYFCDRVVVMYLGRIVETMPAKNAAPRHPYTRALLDSNFEPDPAKRRVVTRLSGEIPSAFDLPPGCAFAARCPRASELCRHERPELIASANDHSTACHHPIDQQ